MAAAFVVAACGVTEPIAPEAPVTPQSDVVLIGDSITYGLESLDKWFGPVAATWHNSGRSGDWTSNVLARIDSIDQRAKTVVVLAGTNDVLQGKGSGAPANLAAIVTTLQAKKVRPVMVLVTPVTRGFQYGNASAFNAEVRVLNAWIRYYAGANGIAVADPYTPLADSDGYGKAEHYREDGLHLNDSGRTVLTTAEAATLRDIRVIP